jgi:hypothetical protein
LLYKNLYTFTHNHFNHEVHMRANAVILVIIGLLLLVGTVGAVITVQVSGNQSWLVAGSGSSAAYTVTVTNTTSGSVPIDGASITFSVDPRYGTMSPTIVTTNSAGQAFSTFTVNTKSGVAPILASISYSGSNGPFTMTQTIPQNIDHGSPFYDFTISPPIFTYPAQGNVTSQVPFNVTILDQWGNPIDNRRGNHYVGLHVSSPQVPDDSNFVGYGQDIYLPLNANGTLSVLVKLTTKSGSNKILMDNFEGKISSQTAEIMAVASGVPYDLKGIIYGGTGPDQNVLPANNRDKFTIDYYIYDKYGNAMPGKSIWMNTNLSDPNPSIDETMPTLHTSDSNGLIRFYYGPKISILTSNITAIAEENSTLRKYLIAKFISSENPSNLFLVVNPQTMASFESDASTTRQAKVIAILNDEFGNPISNKDILFTISPPSTVLPNTNPGPSFEIGYQSLSETAKTDVNGNAILTFYSGSFVKEGDIGYTESATGSCTVTATYTNGTSTLTSNPVIVEWKNFAYLSVVVNATPKTVFLNDTIDVNIKITGDGYKMVRSPITVMLDMDTTSNMNAAASGDTNGLNRFENAKIAGKHFVGTMNSSDQIGLVTYGYYPNNLLWQLVTNITYNKDRVNTSITNLINQGGLDVSIRDSIHEAVTRITTNPTRPADEVAAIITLGDSGYKSGDLDPMVLETWTQNKIRIYTIQYVSSANGCNTGDSKVAAMHTLADSAGGIPFCCTNKNEVYQALEDIKQNLSTIAGVNTSMNLDFQNVHINSTSFNGTMNGTDVFDYVFIGPEIAPQPIHYPDRRTSIIWTDNNQSVVDQTNEWNNYGTLNFTIGTIHIHETWQTTYQLRVKHEGIIDLFGSGSTISYNGNPGTLKLPTTIITAVNSSIPHGLQSGTLEVTNLNPDGGNYTDNVPMTWNLKYTGFDKVTETYWYSFKNQPFVQFGGVSNIPNGTYTPLTNPDYTSTKMDVTSFPMGEYRIKVIAYVPGIPPAEDSGAFTKVFGGGNVSIILQ